MVEKLSEEWVILELSPKAEDEDPDIIRQSIKHCIRDAEVYIPASVTTIGEERVVKYLVDGYAFIRYQHPDSTYFRLENTKYVTGVLKQPVQLGRQARRLATISSKEIDRFRCQIQVEVDQGICVGDTVLITSGPYQNIQAQVEEEIREKDSVQVHIKLRSKEALVTLPRAFLRLVQRGSRSSAQSRLEGLHSWLRMVNTLMGWTPMESSQMLSRWEALSHLDQWAKEGSACARLVQAFGATLDMREIKEAYKEYLRVLTFIRRFQPLYTVVRSSFISFDLTPLKRKALDVRKLQRGSRLYSFVKALYNPPPRPTFDAKYLEWEYLTDTLRRLELLMSEVDTIEQTMEREESERASACNLVIDGMQLAIRCSEAPGLGSLTDSKGRPTGAILGFLRCLASLHKRFPGSVYVCWDSSSQRRRKMFAEYKANRSQRVPLIFEIEFLKKLLPYLGVHQAYNPEEEADDVIATLVRGALAGQSNVIVSTDRDLVQLVSTTDHQFVPAVGAGKERLFDVQAVMDEYGVTPSELVHVRALSGDTSDNIPGAKGVGLKTASKLISLYGSVDAVYASNLAGLTKSQHSALRAAEKQARLNLDLLQLHSDLPLTLIESDLDQNSATECLKEVDIQPKILDPFFG